MKTQFDRDTARELIEDAQQHMLDAITALRRYVDLTGDRHTEAYIVDHLRIMTSADHAFLSRDANLDDVLHQLNQDAEEEEDAADDEMAHEAYVLSRRHN